MSGETLDINQFCSFEFYEWVIFRDKPVQNPDKNPTLGRYLGPSIDIDSALTANILKENDQTVHQSTDHVLSPEALQSQEHIAWWKQFDVNIKEKLSPHANSEDSIHLSLEYTSTYEPYEDDSCGGVTEE
eukprot:1840887-Ditylum_brightwellii.AAC.2